jgi:hypothetical protein
MKCFNHRTVDAVAQCKACGRALCPDCIAEVGRGCSCRDRCEADVAKLNDLVERGRTAYQKTGAMHFRSGLFTLLLGIPFVILGIVVLSTTGDGTWGIWFLLMGILFAAWGVSQFISAKRISQK